MKKAKKLDLENVHTYLQPTDCAPCAVCSLVPGGTALLIALVALV